MVKKKELSLPLEYMGTTGSRLPLMYELPAVGAFSQQGVHGVVRAVSTHRSKRPFQQLGASQPTVRVED